MVFQNIHWLEILQLTSLFAGIFGLVPQIKHVFDKKSLATENLSIITTSVFVLETMIRLPNIGIGLFAALKNRDSAALKRLVMVILGIFGVGFSFYILLVGIAKYNTNRTEKTRRNKKIATFLSVVYGFLILGIVVFLIHGIKNSLETR